MRAHGLHPEEAGFVADVLAGAYRRSKRDANAPRELAILGLWRACVFAYRLDREGVKAHPGYQVRFTNLDELYAFVGEQFDRSEEAVRSIVKRARKRRRL